MDLHYADDLLPTCILQNLSNLWKSGTLCDVLLAAEGRNIAAHKIVLAAASPYFRLVSEVCNFFQSQVLGLLTMFIFPEPCLPAN